ncbi:MAG TPA: hypothetical protein VGL99_13675 [Chloroflexota bacterium]
MAQRFQLVMGCVGVGLRTLYCAFVSGLLDNPLNPQVCRTVDACAGCVDAGACSLTAVSLWSG